MLGLDVNSRLIRSVLFNCPSRLVRAKVVCSMLFDHCCRDKDRSTTRIPSLCITDCQPMPTGGLIGRESYPLCRSAVGVFYSPSRWGGNLVLVVISSSTTTRKILVKNYPYKDKVNVTHRSTHRKSVKMQLTKSKG